METVTSADGTTLAYDRTGDGPPIVLVGGATSDRAGATPLAAELVSWFTVFAFDRRGRGSSGDTTPYAVRREVEDVEAMVAATGERAYVFGMSSGAGLSLEAAAAGVRIERLALYEPPFMVDGPPADMATPLAALIAEGRRGDAVEYFFANGPGMTAEQIAGIRRSPEWPRFERVAHTLVYDSTIMGDSTLLTERVPTVAVPTLVVDGGDSPPSMRRAARAVADAVPDAKHRTLPGQTHAYDPAVLAPVLAEFLLG